MIGQDLNGRTVLDAFGGSGLLAAEAWSRGGLVTVVEKHRKQIRAIQAAAEDLGASWTIEHTDCMHLPESFGRFDIVLADPPYAIASETIVEALESLVGDVLMLEGPAGLMTSERVGSLTRTRRKVYGGTSVQLYRR